MSLEKFNRHPRKSNDVSESKGQKRVKIEKESSPLPPPKVPEETAAAAAKKTRAESRREQKTLTAKRRGDRPHADLLAGLRPHWEVMRQKDTDPATRAAAISSAMSMVAGLERELCKKADSSRLLQSIIQHGGQAERTHLAKVLGGSASIANDLYAQHVLKKLIRECAASREILVRSLRGAVEHFLIKRIACGVLDELYRTVNAGTRTRLIRELYSKEFSKLEPIGEGELGQGGVPSIADYVKEHPAKRDTILGNVRTLIPKLLNKELLMYQVVQRILLDYVSIELPVRLVGGPLLAPLTSGEGALEALLTSPTGCQLVSRLLAVAMAKERKTMIKTLKPLFPVMIRSPSQSQVILTILSYVDDTVLVGKALVPEVLNAIQPTEGSEEGIKVALRSVLLLLSGRLSKYITPQMAQQLAECDALAALSSKKEPATRAAELLEHALPGLRSLIGEHFEVLAVNALMTPLLVEYLELVREKEDTIKANGSSEDTAAVPLLLLRRLAEANGGLLVLGRNPTINGLLRALVKRSEALATTLWHLMEPQLGELLLVETGFLLLVMLRWQTLYEKIAVAIKGIPTVEGSQVGTVLLTKIAEGYKSSRSATDTQ